LGTTYFYSHFASTDGHWRYLRESEKKSRLAPVLSLAIRACGVAAVDNVHGIVRGRDYSRSLYGEALKLLNAALGDARKCRMDENLIAVVLLGYFEVQDYGFLVQHLADVPLESYVR
jgi:hypothetical protein